MKTSRTLHGPLREVNEGDTVHELLNQILTIFDQLRRVDGKANVETFNTTAGHHKRSDELLYEHTDAPEDHVIPIVDLKMTPSSSSLSSSSSTRSSSQRERSDRNATAVDRDETRRNLMLECTDLLDRMESYVKQERLIRRLEDALTMHSSVNEHTSARMGDVAQLLVTIPDKLLHVVLGHMLTPMTPQINGSLGGSFFQHRPYYTELMQQVVTHLIHSFSKEDKGSNISTGMALTQRVVAGIVRRGYADVCSETLFKKLSFTADGTGSDSTQYRALLHVLQGMTESVSAERMVKSAVHDVDYSNATQREALTQAFAHLILQDGGGTHWKQLFTSKLLVSCTFSNVHHLMIIVQSLMECRDRALFIDSTKSVCSVWREEHFVKHSSESQHSYITNATILMMSKLTSAELQKSGILNICLDGVHKRLHSSVPNVRRAAIMVAEKFGGIISASKPLHFEEFQGELQSLELQFMYPLPMDPVKPQTNSAPSGENNKREEGSSARQSLKEKDANKKMKKKRANIQKETELDPDELVFGNDDDDDDDSQVDNGSETGTDSEYSDTDSLQSFGMDEEDNMNDIEEVKPPKYIREVISLLRTNRDDRDAVDKIHMGLKHAATVVRSQLVEENIQFIAVDLVRCLIHLQNSFSLESFEELRKSGMTACVALAPLSTVPFLTRTFYGPHLNVSQRIDILDVLIQAAMELSNRKDDGSIDAESSKDANASDNVYKPKYPPNTRRWGRLANTSKQQKSKLNQFVKFAALFFHSLLAEHNNPKNSFTLFGEDSFVLSKLIYSLGTFVKCCGLDQVSHSLAISTLQFVWALRYRSDRALAPTPVSDHKIFVTTEERNLYQESKGVISVRRSVLFSMSQAFTALPVFILVEELQDLVDEYVQWLINIARNDPDDACRAGSINAVNILRSKLQSLQDKWSQSN